MSKKGGSRHFVRMRAQKRLGVVERKAVKWLLAPSPGPHKKEESVSAGVLLRDVLGKASNLHEVKRILNSGGMLVDGRRVKEPKFPIGLMDVVSLAAEKKSYRMSLAGENMVPKEVTGAAAARKYLKVAGKRTVRGGKIAITFHDGRNYLGDNHIKPGDTCVFSVPEFKMASHLPLAPGVRCLVVKGKHIGEIATLEKIIERPGSHDPEALLSGEGSQFVTVLRYLFVVDAEYA